MTDLSQLREQDKARKEVRELANRGDNRDWLVNKSLRGTSTTEKAFILYYLGYCLSRGIEIDLDAAAVIEATAALERELKTQHNQIRIIKKRRRKTRVNIGVSGENIDLSVLPNSYASALLVVGYLQAQLIGEKPTKKFLPHIIEQAIEATIVWLSDQIVKPDGFIPSLYAGRTPSAYLTFWCAAALWSWREYSEGRAVTDAKRNKRNLQHLVAWSGKRLRDMLAFHYGGLGPQFDIIEVVYASATILLASEASDDRVLVQHALSLLLETYFERGCLEASAPVFTDVTKLSVQISTAEALATIFIADFAGSIVKPFRCILEDHRKSIESTYVWLKDNGNPVKGWYPEGQGRANIPNAYTSASAMLVLAEYAKMLDDCIDRAVWTELGINPFAVDRKLEKIKYPGDLEPLIQQTIIEPISNQEPRIASYSMVLYGPPGTSKTTIAQKVSQGLKWPLLQLDAGSFTRKGRAGIDQAAAEMFEMLKYVKRVVVLFDEVEELVGSRDAPQANMESRLLTTAMLPRLQDLRSRQEIVFILATNRVESIDSAITRLGRFDIVRCVLPPEKTERQEILDQLVKEYELTKVERKFIFDLRIAQKSERFCYGDLRALVREIAIAAGKKVCTRDFVDKTFEYAKNRVISAQDLEPYIKSKEKHDRPSLRLV